MNNSINIREIYKIILHIVLSQDKYQIKRVLPTKTHKKIPYKNQYESTLIRKGIDRVKDFYNEKEELVDLDEKIDELQSTISNVNITVDQLNSLRNQISTLKSQKEDLKKLHFKSRLSLSELATKSNLSLKNFMINFRSASDNFDFFSIRFFIRVEKYYF